MTMEPETKATEPKSRGFACHAALRLEAVVQARAHDVLVEADFGAAGDAGRAVRLAEIGIEILELDAPRAGDVGLDTGAARPAGARLIGAAERRRRLDVAD